MKYYFDIKSDRGRCYSLNYFKDYGVELILEEAMRNLGDGTYYCKELDFIGLKDIDYDECGKFCEHYEPRNGKNGRCRHSKNTYVGSGKFYKLTKENKLIKLEGE